MHISLFPISKSKCHCFKYCEDMVFSMVDAKETHLQDNFTRAYYSLAIVYYFLKPELCNN